MQPNNHMKQHKQTPTYNELPNWQLQDLYPAPDSAEVQRDLGKITTLAQQFVHNYQGKISALSATQLWQALQEYEQISEIGGRLMSYAYLNYAVALQDENICAFYQSIQEKITVATNDLVFFSLEINAINSKQLQQMLAQDSKLGRYHNWFAALGAFKPYQLSDAEEKLLHAKAITSGNAWVRLFDETLESLRFVVDGQTMSCNQAIDLLSNADADKRRAAASEISTVFSQNKRLFAFIMNTLIKDKEIEDQKRGLPQPITERNLANHIEDSVVETLIAVVRENYASLAHRYYKIKAQMFGKDKLPYWDRNAPLPNDDCRHYSWAEAQEIVLSAYADFSPELAKIGQQFFNNPWIDVPPSLGKTSGAFAHPTVTTAHPYLLLNYQGKTRDIMTLAHELGHGVHQVLAAQQGELLAPTPLTLAETASVFGEQLVFRKMLAATNDPQVRRVMIAGKIEDMLNTVIRQIAFCDFEKQLHSARRQGELSAEQIGKIWLQVQRDSLGEAIAIDESYSYYWMYVSHFIHAPFYVYAYAFGDCLVNSLYGLYSQGYPNFTEKYLDLLRAGGSKNYKELLGNFGFDASNPQFWQQGLNVIKGLIDEL